ncbi:MAG: TrbI/VirB10 family protein, partial [Alphaproteobacteria bacterium]|nr:TrbI/VirB10 family protein [Alphaproteobacteria bacterium]
ENVIDSLGNIIGGLTRRWFDKSDVFSNFIEQPDVSDENDEPISLSGDSRKYFKSLGIALTPDGEYLGDILEDDTVINEDGDIVGYRTPDGLIVNDDGNLIGTEEIEDVADEDQSGIFVPAGTFGPGGAYGIGTGPSGNLGPGGGYGPGERYDPARRAALEAAMQERRQNISVGKISNGTRKEAFDGYQKDWSEQGIPKSISSWRVDMSEMIFSDKPIPAVIARAIDTNNPAPITAYVERNVYAEEGRNVIIPAGSRLIGSFGSITAAAEATSESARVQISWERLIRPDGSIFVFSGQTADAQGRAGALGYVDQQLFKKYTLPVVTTVLTSAASYFMASADDAAGQIENSKQQAANDARQNFLDNMESMFNEILADKTDVKAMTYIPAGTRIIIYPNTDLWLRNIERDEEESQKFQKPEILIDDVKTGQNNAAQKREDIAKEGANSSVVYNPDDADVKATGGSAVLINDMAQTQKKNPSVIAPPPAAGTMPSVGTTPATTTTINNDTSTGNGVPALF